MPGRASVPQSGITPHVPRPTRPNGTQKDGGRVAGADGTVAPVMPPDAHLWRCGDGSRSVENKG